MPLVGHIPLTRGVLAVGAIKSFKKPATVRSHPQEGEPVHTPKIDSVDPYEINILG